MKRATHRLGRGMTLLEVLVSLAILAMVSLLIYGSFDALGRGRRGESIRSERARQGREALLRMTREMSEAFLSFHGPANLALLTHVTIFLGQNSTPYDRLDFSAMAHRRIVRDARESDMCEIGYFASPDPKVSGKTDLARREQTPLDMDPNRGGVINVMAESIEGFDVRYLDATTGLWSETWDSTQKASNQFLRLPLEARITLTMQGMPGMDSAVYTTKIMLPMLTPFTFGIPQ